eukprot:gene4173-4727_t
MLAHATFASSATNKRKSLPPVSVIRLFTLTDHESCSEIFNDRNQRSDKNGIYKLKSGDHFCLMNEIPGCGSGVKFGVPQGSILGPVLFNIYVADLQSELSTKGYQYADDTTLYIHAKPKNLEFLEKTTADTLSQLSDWSDRNSLALNSAKTKLMVISTREMSAKHNLKDFKPQICIKEEKLERTDTCKLLGVHLNDNLTWDNHIKTITGSCYGTLAILKKLKNMAPFNLRKQLAESLILSKIDYADQ